MRKYVTLAVLVVGLPACSLLGTDCGRNRPDTYYDVQGIGFSVARQPRDKSWEFAAAGNTVPSRELRLRLTLKERHYTVVPVAGLLPAAYACDPVPAGSLGSTEQMDSLSITSDYDFDALHPAGTQLADLLLVDERYSLLVPSRQMPLEPFRFVELSLREAPATTGPQKFRVYYRQTNGEIYTAETVAITLAQ
ncbi:hypothetical protein [Hymenobacter cellulosivorans]|uniref:DUF5034 domain-containing protein n=1 Tax=Hymenobacter cellulosivorans TaxID=2932249 RepID=A0ABY4F7M2_9BACT|nr:hypothetical protein [Hymenobacter cellulosivorans]UOQ52674.1 hypothetical protein MUN80_23375 [Hymenobacter cellulosivorans]